MFIFLYYASLREISFQVVCPFKSHKKCQKTHHSLKNFNYFEESEWVGPESIYIKGFVITFVLDLFLFEQVIYYYVLRTATSMNR